MSDKEALSDALTNLNSLIQTSSLNATGSIGEIVAQLILLLAHDVATSESQKGYFSKAVTVEQFLSALVGHDQYVNTMLKKTNQEDIISTEMKEGLVCFTHFIKKLDELTHEDVIPDFVARAAAAQLKDRTEGIDLVIPVVLKSGEIGCIVIQVKNIANPGNLTDIAVNALPQSSFFQDQFSCKHFLGLVMSLGESDDLQKEKIKQVKFDYKRKEPCCNFILHGLNKTIYPFLDTDVQDKLKKLLDCDRNNLENMKGIYGEKVLERVAIGCAKYRRLDQC
jgi:hypothetical protein